jgi:integrase
MLKAVSCPCKPEDWVFASTRMKGKRPRAAAAKAGILSSTKNEQGKLVENDPRRFGFHNLRHSLASFLVRTKTDPKMVQALLRHSDVKTTLQLYAYSVSEDRMTAQGQVLAAILQSSTVN